MALQAGAGLYSGAGGGGVSTFIPQEPRFTAREPGASDSSSSSAFKPSGQQVGGPDGASSRSGALTGDGCCTLAFDHGGALIEVATWSEVESRCSQLEKSQAAAFLITAQGATSLAAAKKEAGTNARELPDGVTIFSAGQPQASDALLVRPLDCFQEESIKVGDVEVAPSLLLAHLVVKCVESGISSLEGSDDKPSSATTTKRSAKKASSAKSTGNNTVTLVLPLSYSYMQYYHAIKILQGAGYVLRNVFNRGLATVATHVIENRAALRLDDSVDNVEKGEQESRYDILILYVAVDKDTGAVEAALVQGECHKSDDAARIVDRLYCTSTVHGSNLSEVAATLQEWRASSNLYAALVVGRNDKLTEILASGKSSTIVISARPSDAVKGGCYLSAAELDSSKQYINNDGKWTVAYQLPIADGFLSFDIDMTAKSSEKGPSSVERIFSSGTRIQKREIGPVRPRSSDDPVLVFKKEFSNLLQEEKPAWPKITLASRCNQGQRAGEEDAWKTFANLDPLLTTSSSSSSSPEGVESCTMVLSLDAGMGMVRVHQQKGAIVRELKQTKNSRFRFVAIIVAIVVAVFGSRMALIWRNNVIKEEKVQWLVDFYSVHAPEKLENMTSIRLTLDKFSTKLWALQRSLESKYKAKMKTKAWSTPDL